ncbi:MAG: hypothetical protein L0H84_10790 [Pseudonocardia sp.]|nr:hypothetical protein [Pseudonocardia sp.]
MLAGVGADQDLLLHAGLNRTLQLAGTSTLANGIVILTYRDPVSAQDAAV